MRKQSTFSRAGSRNRSNTVGTVVLLAGTLMGGACGSSDKANEDAAGDAVAASGVPSGVPACGQERSAFSVTGFQSAPGQPTLDVVVSPFDAVVTEVAADGLLLKPSMGPSLKFAWAGPTLVGEFAVGESVSCELVSLWEIVKGTRRTAAVHRQTGAPALDHAGQIPNGPSYSLEPQCVAVDGAQCPATPPYSIHYEVVATLDGSSVRIPMQTTATLGDWQITNINHEEGGGATSCCCFDFFNIGALSALGPR